MEYNAVPTSIEPKFIHVHSPAMRPLLHPSFVNSRFGDPAVYVEHLFERHALMLDLGDITTLPARKINRIDKVFVSHTHIDHFIGFDQLVRICLGRDKTIHLYGPPRFLDQVRQKLAPKGT